MFLLEQTVGAGRSQILASSTVLLWAGVSGLLAFHAHPDDEVMSTGGTLNRYAEAGEQVVVVTATDGAEGEVHNYSNPDEVAARLVEVRAAELAESLSILGVKQYEFLGYRDSGMMGWEANSHPDSFWQADFKEAVSRMVRLIRRYQPEVMTVYDAFGGYGHPDHINVHRVGTAAFFGASDLGRFPLEDGEEFWEPLKLYWSVWPRSRVVAYAELQLSRGEISEEDLERAHHAGTPDRDVSCKLDVRDRVATKMAALQAHRSQIPFDGSWLKTPDEYLSRMIGWETFIRVFSRVECPYREDDLFAGCGERPA